MSHESEDSQFPVPGKHLPYSHNSYRYLWRSLSLKAQGSRLQAQTFVAHYYTNWQMGQLRKAHSPVERTAAAHG